MPDLQACAAGPRTPNHHGRLIRPALPDPASGARGAPREGPGKAGASSPLQPSYNSFDGERGATLPDSKLSGAAAHHIGGATVTAQITRSTIVARSTDLVSAPVGDEVVMMDAESGTFFALDDIGSFVWARLTGPTVVADLLADVQERYEVAPEQCEIDVLTLLQHMHDSDLIRVGD